MSNLTIEQQADVLDQLLEDLDRPTPTAARVIFALDATASRQPTWDVACQVQGELFEAVTGLGRLDVQVVFFRGHHTYRECKASRWLGSAADLHHAMRGITCVSGHTQIERVLDYAIAETQKAKVGALIFVGDAMEELLDPLCQKAEELGRLGVPIFAFQEGDDPNATHAFRQLAQISGGAHLAFDLAGIDRLKQLLGAIAVYATGGQAALEHYAAGKSGAVLQLTNQLRKS